MWTSLGRTGKLISLSIRTDKPEAEIGIYDGEKRLAYKTWPAHRELAETIHKEMKKMLDLLSISLSDVQGIVAYKGPGSFTGLRIGLSVANALAYGLDIPIIAADGDDWIGQGLKQLESGKNEKIALPEYGSAPNITAPSK